MEYHPKVAVGTTYVQFKPNQIILCFDALQTPLFVLLDDSSLFATR